MTGAFELRASLHSAAHMASMDGERQGASDRQIDMIVALARGADDFDVGCGRFLTSAGAARIISEMMARGIEPDWNKSDAELDAEDECAARVEERIRYKAAVKTQDKDAKAFRDAQKLEAALKTATGDKVRHSKFGVGDVVAHDTNTVTAVFPGQKKPLKIGRDFVQFV